MFKKIPRRFRGPFILELGVSGGINVGERMDDRRGELMVSLYARWDEKKVQK